MLLYVFKGNKKEQILFKMIWHVFLFVVILIMGWSAACLKDQCVGFSAI